MSHLQPDNSNELIIQRWRNGIKLVRLTKSKRQIYSEYSVMDYLQLPKPLLVYFYNRENVFQNVNEALAETNGFESAQNAVGKTMYHVAKKESADELIANNLEVIKYEKIKIIEESLERKDDISFVGLSIKSPWYNDDNEVIGVFGCSLMLDSQPISEALCHIAKLGLLDAKGFATKNTLPGFQINGCYLSQREKECLYFCVRGKTASETAKALGLSKRTIETYLANIKIKLDIPSKSDLIEKTREYFL
ncbi:MAG: LuxR C-terminal-related transcriptional regulator [Gammaproteobacteria bacterium]